MHSTLLSRMNLKSLIYSLSSINSIKPIKYLEITLSMKLLFKKNICSNIQSIVQLMV